MDLTKAPNMLAYGIVFNMNFAYEQIAPVASRIFIPNRYFFVTDKPYLPIPGCEPYCLNDAGNYLGKTAYYSSALNKHFVTMSGEMPPSSLTEGGNNQKLMFLNYEMQKCASTVLMMTITGTIPT